jgi:hypothetical protein
MRKYLIVHTSRGQATDTQPKTKPYVIFYPDRLVRCAFLLIRRTILMAMRRGFSRTVLCSNGTRAQR